MISKPSKLQPALAGGLILGLGSSLPLTNIGNYCCCLWAVLCGLIAAKMLVNRSPVLPVTSGDGATAGLLGGIVGAAISLMVAVPIELLGWSANIESARQMSDRLDDAATRAIFAAATNLFENHPIGLVMLSWLVFALFSTGVAALSGAIGVSFFEKRRDQIPPSQPQPPPEQPPQHNLPFDPGPPDYGNP